MNPLPEHSRFHISSATAGVITIAVAAALVVFIFGGLIHKVSENGRTVKAVFGFTNDMAIGSQVREHGIQVGRVTKISVNRGGRSATVEMKVSKDGFPLYADASAAIRWRNLLGSTMIVDLDRGTPAAGPMNSDVVPQSRTMSQVELDPIISIFRNKTRAGLRTMIGELPHALQDRPVLKRTFGTLADVAPSLQRGVVALRGERDGDLRALVRNTARTVQAVDEPVNVRDLVQGGAQTLATTARRQADVQSMIADSARVAPRVTDTLQRVDTTLGIADPVIDRLRAPAAQVAPTAAALRPVVGQADTLLRDARPLLHSLRPAASSVAAAAKQGLPFLGELAPSLDRVDEQVLPGFAKRSPASKLTTYEMIGPFFASFGALAAHFDSRGHYVRFPVSGSERTVNAGPCRAFFTDPEAGGFIAAGQTAPLLRCKSLMEATAKVLTATPPAPGGK